MLTPSSCMVNPSLLAGSVEIFLPLFGSVSRTILRIDSYLGLTRFNFSFASMLGAIRSDLAIVTWEILFCQNRLHLPNQKRFTYYRKCSFFITKILFYLTIHWYNFVLSRVLRFTICVRIYFVIFGVFVSSSLNCYYAVFYDSEKLWLFGY